MVTFEAPVLLVPTKIPSPLRQSVIGPLAGNSLRTATWLMVPEDSHDDFVWSLPADGSSVIASVDGQVTDVVVGGLHIDPISGPAAW